ncbi:hypothetical protein AHAS_Ahas16G0150900 [Arachis hypogaea]
MRKSDHVSAVLNGLTEEYDSLITSIVARSVSISVGEFETLLLTHKSMLDQFRKPELFVQASMTHHTQNYNMRGGFREEI